MSSPQVVLDAAHEVQLFCLSQNWPFCFIGGVAVQRWGDPRFTHDVDLTLLTGFGNEERFIEMLIGPFHPRRPDAAAFALINRVLLLKTKTGVEVDIALGGFPFEERSVARASKWDLPGNHSLITCSAEDLIVHKAFAGRSRDWDDVERILIRQNKKLNYPQIETELAPLLELKGETESLEKLRRLRSVVTRRLNEPN